MAACRQKGSVKRGAGAKTEEFLHLFSMTCKIKQGLGPGQISKATGVSEEEILSFQNTKI